MILIFVTLFFSLSLALIKNDFLCNSTIAMTARNYICIKDRNYLSYNVPKPWPLIVGSEIVIYEVTEIDEIDHSITLYMSLALIWSDEGLNIMRNSESM